MWRSMLCSVIFIVLFASPSLCNLNRQDLAAAVDAFDSFVNVPKSSKTADKKVLKVNESPIEVLPSVIEKTIVKEEAHCITCPVKLNVSNIDLITLANNSLLTTENGSNLEFIRLIHAVRKIENRIVYNLKVEAVEKCENSEKLCKNMICDIELVHKPWKYSKPKLTYCNCIPVDDNEEESTTLTDGINVPEKQENKKGSIPNIYPNLNEFITHDNNSKIESVPDLLITDTQSSTYVDDVTETTETNVYTFETTLYNEDTTTENIDLTTPKEKLEVVVGISVHDDDSFGIDKTVTGYTHEHEHLINEETTLPNEEAHTIVNENYFYSTTVEDNHEME